jgi:hypothetical protein
MCQAVGLSITYQQLGQVLLAMRLNNYMFLMILLKIAS